MIKVLPLKRWAALCLLCLVCSIPHYSNAQLSVHTNRTALELAQLISGNGVTVSNATLTCDTGANGTFFEADITMLGIDSGILLTTGTAAGVATYATDWTTDRIIGKPGDADLTTLSGNPTFDACKLEYDIKPLGNSISVKYVFGSEEYNEGGSNQGFNCGPSNDVFGLFISGGIYTTPTNFALIPSTTIPVCINSINDGNAGNCPGCTLSECTSLGAGSPFTALYRDNWDTVIPTFNNDITYNGQTALMTATVAVDPCETYHIKLAIADAFDSGYDSGLFIMRSSFNANATNLTLTPTTAAICVGSYVQLTAGGADSYSWFPTTGLFTNAALTIPYTGGNNSTVYASPSTTTTYSAVGHRVIGCNDTLHSIITINPIPTITSIVATPASVCSGQQSSTIVVTGTPGATVFTDFAPWLFTIDGTGHLSIPTGLLTTATTYNFLAVAKNGCFKDINQSITITINPLPVTSIPTTTYTICSGSTTNIPVTGNTPFADVVYLIDNTTYNGVVLDASGNAVIAETFINTTGFPESHTIDLGIVVNVTTGCSDSGIGIATVVVLPSPTESIGGNKTICSGDSWDVAFPIHIFGTANAKVIYKDYNNILQTVTTNPSGYVDLPFPSNINPGTTPITYTYTLDSVYLMNSPYCGKHLTGSVTLTVNPLPTITATASPDSICLGQSSTLTASGGTSYTWTPTASLSCSTCTNTVATPTATTTYTVTGYNSYGCHSTGQVAVTVHPNVIHASPITICEGLEAQLHATGGTVYNWTPSTSLSCTPCSDPIATPTTTTTYTITGVDTFGCNETTTVTVTVNPKPVVTVSVTPNPICLGTTVTMIPSGASTYSWLPAGPTVTPTATTTYTVVGSTAFGCKDTADITIVVDTLPLVSNFVLTGPNNFCNGGSTTLQITGSPNATVNYTANAVPQTPVVLDATGNYTLTVSPAVTTTYTLTNITFNAAPFCSKALNMSVTVTVLPVPTVTFNPHGLLLCGTSGVTLNPIVTNAATYSWTANPVSPVCPSCTNPFVNPAVTTTYILTVDAGNGCPVAKDSVKVVVPTLACVCQTFCATGTTILGPFGVVDADIPAGTYYMDDDVKVVGGNRTFSSAKIVINNNKTMTVDSNTQLTMTNSHLFDCDNMWNGIVLQSSSNPAVPVSGRIQVLKESLIEDAKIGILADHAYTPAGYSVANPSTRVINTLNVIFNHNTIGIKISNYTEAGVANYPFAIAGTVFTSRNMNIGPVSSSCTQNYPYTWPETSGIHGLMTDWTVAPYTPPFNIDNPTGNALNAPFVISNCHNGLSATAGIVLDNVGPIDTTTADSTYPGMYVGASQAWNGTTIVEFAPNLFDNLGYGIHATNSNLYCGNGRFIHINKAVTGTYAPGGSGVYTKATDNTNHYQLYMNGTITSTDNTNRFYDCINGVESYEYYKILCYNSYMYSSHLYNVPASRALGMFGYLLQSSRYQRIEVKNNNLFNINYGISLHTTPGSGASPSIAGPINISYNTIGARLYSNFEYTYRGISVENLNNPILAINNRLRVNGNTIGRVYNGIYVANYQTQTAESDSNRIDVVQDADSLYKQKGIEHVNCIQDFISNNEVSGPGALVPNVPNAYTGQILVGIRGSGNQQFVIGCNKIHDINTDFEFYFNLNTGKWGQNRMANSKFGYVLYGGVIGDQFGVGTPSHNFWDVGITWHTYGIGALTVPTSSRLYVNNNPGFVPTSNGGTVPGAIYGAGSIILTPNSTLLDCNTLGINGPQALRVALPEKAATGDIDYTGNVELADWMAQYSTYQQLYADSTLSDSSTILQTFKSMAQNSRYHHIRCIEDKLAIGDTTNAKILLTETTDSLANTDEDVISGVKMTDDTLANLVVNNYKLYYKLYLMYMANAMTQSDSLQVAGMANLCPMINGAVVYQARSLYSLMFHDLTSFNDDLCDTTLKETRDTIARAKNSNSKNGESFAVVAMNEGQQYALYPNPNNGEINLQQSVADDQPVQMKIWNNAGQTISLRELKFEGGHAKIWQGLTPGLYAIQLTDNQGRVFMLKFVAK